MVAHTSCLRSAALAIESGIGSPIDVGMDCGEGPRDTLRHESSEVGLGAEDVGVKDSGGDYSDDGFEAPPSPPRIWVCSHCTREHLLQINEGHGK